MDKISLGAGNTFTTYVEPDTELIINKRKIYKEKYPNHSMISWLNRKDSRKFKMDLLKILTTISKSELILFEEIKSNCLSDTGIAVMSQFEDHPNMENIYRRINKLIEANLIRKMIPIENPEPEIEELKSNLLTPERYTYMINPDLIIPWKYTLSKKVWELIDPVKEKE